MDIRDEISRKKKEEWYEVWFAVEALGVTEDVVKSSLGRHIESLSATKDVFVYEKDFRDIRKVEKPMKDVDHAYSQVVNVKFFAKDLPTLLGVVMLYGPSSIEVMGPHRKTIGAAEAQDICNVLAGLVHQFAAAGAGGIVITPEKKK